MMIKDTFFSASRFMNICRKEVVENWRSNLLRLILLYGVMVVILVWNGYLVYDENWKPYMNARATSFAMFAFVWFLFGFGTMSASFVMEKMKSKTGRLSVLMTPATSFEKYFSRWLIYTVVFLLVFLIAFRLADYTRVLVFSLTYPEHPDIAAMSFSHFIGDTTDYKTLCNTPLQFMLGVSAYLFLQSLFVLGSAVWPKNAFLKTFVAGAVIFILYLLISFFMTKLLLTTPRPYYDTRISVETSHLCMTISLSVLAVMNWVLGYFRFKESEIIHRM